MPHAIIDNKHFQIFNKRKGRQHAARRSVRGAYQRTLAKGELIKPHLVRPKANTKFPAKSIAVTAAVIKGRIRMWDYVEGKWNGEKAAYMYRVPLLKAMKRAYPLRRRNARWTVLEDNDPSGYKSGKAIDAKEEVNIVTNDLPKRSPDFNVLDYSLWHAINTRMRMQEQSFREGMVDTNNAFLSRLRRTAMGLPPSVVRRAVGSMPRRVRLCVKAKGGLFIEN